MPDRKPGSKAVVGKRTKARASSRARAIGCVDLVGQRFRIVLDPKLKIDGEIVFEDAIIRLRPMAHGRMKDTFLHELVHGMIENSGMGWAIRRHLRMTKAKWHEFEETFIVRLLTPVLLSTLERAGWLRLPRFSTGRNRGGMRVFR